SATDKMGRLESLGPQKFFQFFERSCPSFGHAGSFLEEGLELFCGYGTNGFPCYRDTCVAGLFFHELDSRQHGLWPSRRQRMTAQLFIFVREALFINDQVCLFDLQILDDAVHIELLSGHLKEGSSADF